MPGRPRLSSAIAGIHLPPSRDRCQRDGRCILWYRIPEDRNSGVERLDDLEAFVAIVEKGSQAAASRHLRRPLQSLNRSLIALDGS